MIFFKIWRETRCRFFALLATLGVVLVMVGYSEFGSASDLPAQNWWSNVSEAWVAASFVIVVLLATVLGPGGLVTEVSEGVASFSLSLPICRRDYHWKRALVCFGELTAVSVVSIALLILTGSFFQTPAFEYPLLALPLWMSLSAFAVYALSFLVASWLTDRLTPVVVVIAIFTSLCICFL